MRRSSWLLLTSTMMAGCGAAHVPGAPFAGATLLAPLSEAEAAHDGLLRADLARGDSAATLGVARGLTSAFASNVVYLRGGLPIVRGRAPIAAILAAESLGAGVAVRWQPVRAEASADGASGFTYGYTLYGANAGAAPTLRVDRYIAFWRKENDVWRIAAYAETYGAPPPPLTLPREAASAEVKDEPMPRVEGPLEEMRQADVAFSAMARKVGTGRAFGEFAAPNAQIFSTPGEFITGPAAISAAFGPPDSSTLVWRPVVGEIAGSGDIGFTVGNAEHTGRREDGTAFIRYSKYLTVWKRQRDGSWRYVVDGGSARPQP